MHGVQDAIPEQITPSAPGSIRHSVSCRCPPHYQAVMMIDDQDDEELPTYDEALAKTLE